MDRDHGTRTQRARGFLQILDRHMARGAGSTRVSRPHRTTPAARRRPAAAGSRTIANSSTRHPPTAARPARGSRASTRAGSLRPGAMVSPLVPGRQRVRQQPPDVVLAPFGAVQARKRARDDNLQRVPARLRDSTSGRAHVADQVRSRSYLLRRSLSQSHRPFWKKGRDLRPRIRSGFTETHPMPDLNHSRKLARIEHLATSARCDRMVSRQARLWESERCRSSGVLCRGSIYWRVPSHLRCIANTSGQGIRGRRTGFLPRRPTIGT